MAKNDSDTTFKPVEKKSLADAVFEQLKGEIVSGRMEPGDALPAERGLSEMLGVNRGAVREALKRLEQARLITIQQGGVTRVRDYLQVAGTDLLSSLLVDVDGELDTRVARSVMEMRSALAGDIARLAARRANEQLLADVQKIVEEMEEQKKDIIALQDLSIAFWRKLVEGSDNVAYQLSLNSLEESYSKFKHLLTQTLAEEFGDLEGYQAVLAAMREGDEEEASVEARQITELGEAKIKAILAVIDEKALAGK